MFLNSKKESNKTRYLIFLIVMELKIEIFVNFYFDIEKQNYVLFLSLVSNNQFLKSLQNILK